MKLLRPGQTIALVWSLDPDLDIPDERRRVPFKRKVRVKDDAGLETEQEQTTLEGVMLPVSEVGELRSDTVIWEIRPMTPREYADLRPEQRNHEVIAMCLVRVRQGEDVYDGDDAVALLHSVTMALIGDLAWACWQVTLDHSFRERVCTRPRLV